MYWLASETKNHEGTATQVYFFEKVRKPTFLFY